jgi:bifunctional non-homologous end joining protein LigD
MTHLLPEFRPRLPDGLQLDGELVALGDDGRPDLHGLSSRMLHGRGGITLTLFVFDVLAVEGLATTMLPYMERRAILEALDVENQRVRLVATFEDGESLFAAVCARGLEGIVAKRTNSAYMSGDRGSWTKTKNRSTPRFAEERRRALRGGVRAD